MAKALKTVAIVAGVVALVATGVGALAGAGLLTAATAAGAATAATIAATAATVASIASAVAIAASLGAGALQKKPPAQGSASQIQIGSNMPMPYALGRTYVGGNLLHDVGYGGTVNGVPNPYRSLVLAWSGGGPVQAIEAIQADFTTITFSGGNAVGYYSGFMSADTQLGATPEVDALAGPYGAIPNWGSSYKLSGYAAGLITLKFDKKGKVYASGIPQFGAIVQGAKAYDPRLDSTYTGGLGTQRWDDESTWAYTENPALHALTYARGRYQNITTTDLLLTITSQQVTIAGDDFSFYSSSGGKKVFGCGFPKDSIDFASFVAFANICDANGWKVGGVISEPGSRWDNLKRILAAGAAVPMFVGARLAVKYQTPRVALDTIEFDDLADGEYRVPAMKSWKDRLNGIVPTYRSEAHKWEFVQSDTVSVGSYVTEDGEEKTQAVQYDLVQDKDQAAKLAAYELVNRRELGPIILPCKPRMIEYVPGEALEVDIPEIGLASQLCIITGRKVDPATGIVELTLESETSSKHAFALGQTGTAPPSPALLTGADMDLIIATPTTDPDIASLIALSYTIGLAATFAQTNAGTSVSVTVPTHVRAYPAPIGNVAVNGATITGLSYGTTYLVYYDDPALAGGNVTYQVTTSAVAGYNSSANPYRHFVAWVTTMSSTGTGGEAGGGAPPGSGGGGKFFGDGPIP